MMNSSVGCLGSPTLQQFKHATNYIVLVASLFASLCNMLIIYCAWRIVRRNRVFTHVFVMWMSLADLLLTVYSNPMHALNKIVTSLHSVLFCASIQFTTWLGLALSGIFLTAINIDRYIFFNWPMKYILLPKMYAVAVCVVVVSSSVCSVTALWASKAAVVTQTCITAFTHGGVYPYIVFITTTCVLPIVSSLLLSTYLYVMTSRRRRTLPASNPKRSSKHKVNSLLFKFATSLWTTASLLPSRIVLTWYFLVFKPYVGSKCPNDFVLWLTWAASLATQLYPTVNPIITGLICAPYRRELALIFNEIKSMVLSKK